MRKPSPETRRVRHYSAMRLGAMVRKEFLQIIRDPSSIAIAFILPVILLFIFGYGVSLDATHVPIAIIVEQPSAETASLTGAFASSDYFDVTLFSSIQDAENAVRKRLVHGIVWLRGNFAQEVLSGNTAAIGVFVNGVDANTARIVEGYAQGVWATWLSEFAASRGRTLDIPIEMEYRIWFNPAVRSRNYLVPGMMAIIMTLIGALLTALVIAREWERGTMEALMVTPIRVGEILLGKIIPYFAMGMGGLILSLAMTLWLFEVPMIGSLPAFIGLSALFLLAALGMGLLISTLAKNQFVAGQAAIITTFLPALILSGIIFDIGSMPAPIRAFTHLFAARYYVAILQTIFAAGNIWPVLIPNALALLGMAIFFFMTVRRKTSKRLD